jgi:phenylalanyl-tRNA synthetase beta chain
MRVSLQWLQELVAGPADAFNPEVLAERLSIAGFEVEGIEDLSAQAAGVVVGRVEAREPHPDADKLSVCQVRVGDGEVLQIVCGAANVRAGIHVPVALVGSTLPAVNLTIKPAELRGVASSGMICSLAELGLADSSDGIAILDELLDPVPAVGTPVGPSFGLDDQVLELAITANRPDGQSMQGIAREVAALVNGQVMLPAVPALPTALPMPVAAEAQRAMDQGGLFSITALSGLSVAPSPLWLQRRLQKAGIRPINNVVDITNLVMLETGQPLHAYDQQSLAEAAATPEISELGLRAGRSDEPFTSLDGEERRLDDANLVVTYADRPIALAGVIGGLAEGVQATTTAIWLEAAVFAPQQVRRSARQAGLRSEACSRFEKGLPVESTLDAADRAVQLLQDLCGAEVQQRWLHSRPHSPRQPLSLRRDALLNLLGPVQLGDEPCDLPDARIVQTLEAIGCVVQADADGEGWTVLPPPSRAIDLQREVDLIEEVARLVGYDQFACHLPDPIEPGGLTPTQQAERRLRRSLCAAGLQEACSFSLMAAAPGRLSLANPLLADYGHLRDELHSELLAAARRNLQSGQAGFWAFEIGSVFTAADPERSELLLAGVICGARRAEIWSSSGKPQPPSYFQARGVLQQALADLALAAEDRPLRNHPLLHPGRAAELVLEGRPLGWFGQLHPQRAAELDLPEHCYLFQLAVEPLLVAATRRNRWQPAFIPFATVPASERDLAVVVPVETTCSSLLQVIRKAGKPLLELAELVDRFESEQLGEGRCSQAFRLRYRDARRTLTDEDVELCHTRVRQALERQCGAELRS